MTSDHCSHLALFDRINSFAMAVACNEVTEEQWVDFERLLRESDDACRLYFEYVEESDFLQNVLGAVPAEEFDFPAILPPALQDPVDPSRSGFVGGVWHGTVGYFSSGWPVAYLVAAVICGVGLLIGTLTHVSQPVRMATSEKGTDPLCQNGPKGPPLPSPLSPLHSFVGRITGMVDCKWADPATETVNGAHVPLGRKYSLSSGLLEIAYATGAKVILQGPVTYEVESATGGYLSVGKLTARVEKKVGSGEWRVESAKQQPANPQSLIPNPSLSTTHYPLFTVKTPTATVTDLGTEFGVEVTPSRLTQVYVSEGRVTLRPLASDSTQEVILTKGESSQVDVQGMMVRQSESETANLAGKFVHQLPRPIRTSYVSLTDLVAGGNGFGDRAFWGINPQDASVIPQIATGLQVFDSTGKYERYSGNPQIDGVFIPNGNAGPVQIDSAGHVFTLPKTCGKTCDLGAWAYNGVPWEQPSRTKPQNKQDVKQSSMLLLHANVGITFDLAAIRTDARGQKPTRFQATVRNCQWDTPYVEHDAVVRALADVWVLIDGKLRFGRVKLQKKDDPIELNIPLETNDRFLTLISTDGGDGICCDEITYLNPRILLEAVPRGAVPEPE